MCVDMIGFDVMIKLTSICVCIYYMPDTRINTLCTLTLSILWQPTCGIKLLSSLYRWENYGFKLLLSFRWYKLLCGISNDVSLQKTKIRHFSSKCPWVQQMDWNTEQISIIKRKERFVYIEECLHPWDRFNLIMVYDLFNVWLDSVC